jgi:hypothetical protein
VRKGQVRGQADRSIFACSLICIFKARSVANKYYNMPDERYDHLITIILFFYNPIRTFISVLIRYIKYHWETPDNSESR